MMMKSRLCFLTVRLPKPYSSPDPGPCNYWTTIDERTKNSLSNKPSRCLLLRLIFVLSSIIVLKLQGPGSGWGDIWRRNSTKIMWTTDSHYVGDAQPLKNNASYMIMLIFVSEILHFSGLIIKYEYTFSQPPLHAKTCTTSWLFTRS